MIDKICLLLTNKIRKEMPEVDDERAEIINYGLHLIIGELPKTFIILGLSYFLGVFKLTLLTVILLLPYRAVSGGFHLKTHIGCIVGTTLIYSGVAKISNYIIFSNQILKCIIAVSVWIFGMIMVHLYAPADTENHPLVKKEVRKQLKSRAVIVSIIYCLLAIFAKPMWFVNILMLMETYVVISILPVSYKIFRRRYNNYEEFNDEN